MTDPKSLTLTQTRLADGVWEGVLSGGSAAPVVEAWHQGARLETVAVTPLPGSPGQHLVRVQVPVGVISEGVQTVVLMSGGQVVGHFTVIAGAAADEDLRAEVGLLRAELDLLKRAFQRQFRKT